MTEARKKFTGTGGYALLFVFCLLTSAQANPMDDELSTDETNALVRQVEQHWNVPVVPSQVLNAVIQIHIDVNPDRTVLHADIISFGDTSGNPYYRAVAESALRAVYASSPLNLPEGKYEQWKDIDISFSAKDML